MKISKVFAVYFSAVENTRKVTEAIAARMADAAGVSCESIDFTLPGNRSEEGWSFGADELVVFGTPTYAGRIPNKVLPFVQTLFRGNGTPAVAVVTFGNRSYDNSLMELREELAGHGFLPFAAGAFACRHVFSNVIAMGRPDEEDMKVLERFADGAAEKLAAAGSAEGLGAPVTIGENLPVGPYYTPLGIDGQPAKFLKAKPVTDPELCDGCGICVMECPMGSIDPEDPANVTGVCIKCHACIRKCPKGAKHFEDPAFLSHVAMLEQNYTRRAEPEIWL